MRDVLIPRARLTVGSLLQVKLRNMSAEILSYSEDGLRPDEWILQEWAAKINKVVAELAVVERDAGRYRLMRKSWVHPTPEQMDAYLDSIEDQA